MKNLAPLTLAQAIEIAPAIATDHPHPYKGEGFVHINTKQVLEAMLDSGFAISSAQQTKGGLTPRGVNTRLYNTHVVRLRDQRAFNDLSVGDSIPEVLIYNSHDGSGCFFMTAGLFRLVCSNGMVVGESYESLRVQHRWISPELITEDAKSLWERVPQLVDWRSRAIERDMSPEEQSLFASRAQVLRFPARDEMPFPAQRLLESRRREDSGNHLWGVFNRVQENIIRGGIEGRTANNRITRMRGITSVQTDLELNRNLWDLADAFLEAA